MHWVHDAVSVGESHGDVPHARHAAGSGDPATLSCPWQLQSVKMKYFLARAKRIPAIEMPTFITTEVLVYEDSGMTTPILDKGVIFLGERDSLAP